MSEWVGNHIQLKCSNAILTHHVVFGCSGVVNNRHRVVNADQTTRLLLNVLRSGPGLVYVFGRKLF